MQHRHLMSADIDGEAEFRLEPKVRHGTQDRPPTLDNAIEPGIDIFPIGLTLFLGTLLFPSTLPCPQELKMRLSRTDHPLWSPQPPVCMLESHLNSKVPWCVEQYLELSKYKSASLVGPFSNLINWILGGTHAHRRRRSCMMTRVQQSLIDSSSWNILTSSLAFHLMLLNFLAKVFVSSSNKTPDDAALFRCVTQLS